MDKITNATIKRSGGMMTVKGRMLVGDIEDGAGGTVNYRATKIDRVEIPGDGTVIAYDVNGKAVAQIGVNG